MRHSLIVACAALITSTASAQQLRFVATDYAFLGSTTARPGINRVTLVNHGHDVHHVVITSVPAGMTVKQLWETVFKNEPGPSGAQDFGGPNATSPGDSSSALVDLKPGLYMVECWIVAPDMKPHIMKGMFTQLEVKGPSNADAAPKADVVISAKEYALAVSRPLRAGSQVIRFENKGTQTHDLQLVRLDAGAVASAIPRRVVGGDTTVRGFQFVGGLAGISPKHTAWTRVTLRPGRYAMMCFVPDEKDGKPHADHGMLSEFRIPGPENPRTSKP